MRKEVQFSIWDQISLTLACAVIFSTAITAAGYLGTAQTRPEVSDSTGVVEGAATGRRVDIKTDPGVDRPDSLVVANSISDRYAVPGPEPTTYRRSRPEWLHVSGAEPTTTDAGIFDGALK